MIKMEEWKQYYEKMLNEDRSEYMRLLNVTPRRGQNEVIARITKREIYEALRRTKNGRAPGPGNIPIELVKHSPGGIMDIIQDIFNRCLIDAEQVPEEWKLGYMSSIYKKGSRTDCRNYRGINVTASIGRLYGRVIKSRLEQEVMIGEEQCGFTAGRSCVDNIFTLKQLAHKRIARSRETHLVFVDLEKAYDTVPLQKLFEVLYNSTISHKYIDTIRDLYEGQSSVIKIGSEISESFIITKGLRQGCCLSPTLFKIYIDKVLQEWQVKCRSMGVDVNGEYLYSLLFADDQVVIALDEDDSNYMMRKLTETYEKWGLKINFDKTKYLVIGGEGKDMDVNGKTVKVCREFKYLGSVISAEGSSRKDINSRIIQGRQAVQKLNSMWWSDQLNKPTKKRIYNSIVQSILTYGSEAWEITRRDSDRLRAVEMDALRRSCRVSRLERIRNEEIRRWMNKEDTVTEEIERRKLVWYGHVRRMEQHRWPQRIWA
jgi:hypothetical protein